MKLGSFLCVLMTLLSFPLSAKDYPIERDTWEDFKNGFELMADGAIEQFRTKTNLYYLPVAVGGTWYAFEEDDRISSLMRNKKMDDHVDIVGELGVPLNFPLVSAGFYAWGRQTDNEHAMHFALEYFSALYLPLAESGLLSLIPVHERPVKDKVDFWEKAFRGDSSFPSGHIIPYASLFFKTLQFYGPYWSILPGVLTVMSGQQRVQDGKHHLSDVVGAVFLTAFASEGVRQAAGYAHNHPFYQRFFEGREVELGLIQYQGQLGPRVVWRF